METMSRERVKGVMNKLIICLLVALYGTGCGSSPSLALSGLNGQQGEAGGSGAAGSQGPAGPSGAGLTIAENTYCTRIDNSVGPTILIQYQSVKYSTGDRYVSCTIVHTDTQAVGSRFYSAAQVGATNGQCLLTDDLDAASSGTWNFSYIGSFPTAVYIDGSSGYSGHTINYNTNDCVTN